MCRGQPEKVSRPLCAGRWPGGLARPCVLGLSVCTWCGWKEAGSKRDSFAAQSMHSHTEISGVDEPGDRKWQVTLQVWGQADASQEVSQFILGWGAHLVCVWVGGGVEALLSNRAYGSSIVAPGCWMESN